mgnify:CR=1 FL=1
MVKVGDKVRVKRGHWRAGEVGIVDAIHEDGTITVKFEGILRSPTYAIYYENEVEVIEESILEESIGG